MPTARAVGLAATTDGGGYWVASSTGGVYPFGDARSYGSMSGRALNSPIVGLAPTHSGNGYWLVASDGGIFSYGDAHFFGSTGALRLNEPIVGMAATPSGQGYWLVASDGGIFSYGDAHFFGSTGSMRPERTGRRHGGHTVGAGLLARRLRRRHLQLRRRALLRLDRVDAT